MASCKFALLPLALLAGLCSVFVKSLRWRRMLHGDMRRFPLRKSVGSYYSSVYLGLVTPGRLGELARIFYLKRDLGYSAAGAMASVILDRLYDLYALIVMGVFALFFFGFARQLSVQLALGLAALMLFPVLLVHPRFGGWFFSFFVRRVLRRRLASLVEHDVDIFYEEMKRLLPVNVVWNVLMTSLASLFAFAGAVLMARSLGIETDAVEIALLFSLCNLVSLLPITVAGAGTRDAVLVVGFASLGLARSQAVAFSSLILSIYFVATGLVCFLFFLADRPAEKATTPP